MTYDEIRKIAERLKNSETTSHLEACQALNSAVEHLEVFQGLYKVAETLKQENTELKEDITAIRKQRDDYSAECRAYYKEIVELKHALTMNCDADTQVKNVLSSLNLKRPDIAELKDINHISCKVSMLREAEVCIRRLYSENTEFKARLQPTPEAPEIDKITCLEADIVLRDDTIEELKTKLARVDDTRYLEHIIVGILEKYITMKPCSVTYPLAKAIQKYVKGLYEKTTL